MYVINCLEVIDNCVSKSHKPCPKLSITPNWVLSPRKSKMRSASLLCRTYIDSLGFEETNIYLSWRLQNGWATHSRRGAYSKKRYKSLSLNQILLCKCTKNSKLYNVLQPWLATIASWKPTNQNVYRADNSTPTFYRSPNSITYCWKAEVLHTRVKFNGVIKKIIITRLIISAGEQVWKRKG